MKEKGNEITITKTVLIFSTIPKSAEMQLPFIYFTNQELTKIHILTFASHCPLASFFSLYASLMSTFTWNHLWENWGREVGELRIIYFRPWINPWNLCSFISGTEMCFLWFVFKPFIISQFTIYHYVFKHINIWFICVTQYVDTLKILKWKIFSKYLCCYNKE